MNLELIFFLCLIEVCWTVPINNAVKPDIHAGLIERAKRQIQSSELTQAASKLTPEQRKKAFTNYFGLKNVTTSKDVILMEARMHNNDPDIYTIMEASFKSIVREFTGEEEAKQYLKYYYDRVSGIKDDTDSEFDRYVADVAERWNKLSSKSKSELTAKFGDMVNSLKSDSSANLETFSANNQKAYKEYFVNATTEEDSIRVAARMNKESPELFKIYEASYKNLLKTAGMSKDATNFLDFYYAKVRDLKSDSNDEIEKHRKAVHEKWDQLNKNTQSEVDKKFPSTLLYIEDQENIIKAYKALSPERQIVYKSYFNDKTKQLSGGRTVRMFAKMHNNDPDIYQIVKLIFANLAKKFDTFGSDFVKYYFEQLDKIPNESQTAFDTFDLIVRKEWNKLDKKTQETLNADFSGFGLNLNN